MSIKFEFKNGTKLVYDHIFFNKPPSTSYSYPDSCIIECYRNNGLTQLRLSFNESFLALSFVNLCLLMLSKKSGLQHLPLVPSLFRDLQRMFHVSCDILLWPSSSIYHYAVPSLGSPLQNADLFIYYVRVRVLN